MFKLIGAMLAFALIAMFFGQLANASAPLRDRLSIKERWYLGVATLGIDAGVVTLADAQKNTQDDVDLMVIDEFRKESWLLDNMQFDDVVNPAGGGATLTYGYTRLITQPTAGFRALNAEYTPQEVTRDRFTVDLKPLGGSFQVDRVLANLGPAASSEVTLQMQQKIKAARTAFQDAVINGDTAVDANGFDGLDKALTGTSTEIGAAAVTDWRTVTFGDDSAFAILDDLDALLAELDGAPTAILANKAILAKLRAASRRSGAYSRDVVQFSDGSVTVERYGNIVLVDPGEKAGSSTDIIPVEARTVATVAGNYTDIYAVRLGLDGFHGVSVSGSPLVKQWLPDFTTAGAVKTGEVEMGPVAVALKNTKAAAVLRNVRLS